MDKVRQFLNKLNLKDKEVNVFLAGLKNGPMHATQLAKECGISRTNVYAVLNKLKSNGLCHQLGSLYGRKYKMALPSDIQTLLNRKQHEYHELQNELQHLVPNFQSIIGAHYTQYPQVEYFEGVEGIKTLLEDTIRVDEKIVRVANSVINFISLVGDEFTKYLIKKRTQRNIICRSLRFSPGEIDDPMYQSSKQYLLEVRYAPPSVQLNATMFLYDDKVALITSKKENLGILMQSQDYSSTLKSWYNFIWELSTKRKPTLIN